MLAHKNDETPDLNKNGNIRKITTFNTIMYTPTLKSIYTEIKRYENENIGVRKSVIDQQFASPQ